jgi:hypothetical protein
MSGHKPGEMEARRAKRAAELEKRFARTINAHRRSLYCESFVTLVELALTEPIEKWEAKARETLTEYRKALK